MSDYKCPECGNEDNFEVSAETIRMVTIDGESNVIEDPGGDVFWDPESEMVCGECRHEAQVSLFEQEVTDAT